MSCRVFSRRLEYAIQEILIKKSKQTGCQFIHLEHKVTDRNGILTDVIRNIGYDDLGGNKYEMSIKGTYKLIEHYIKITTMEII